MIKRKFTTVTQLHEKNNQDIIDYFESARGTYGVLSGKLSTLSETALILTNLPTIPIFKKLTAF